MDKTKMAIAVFDKRAEEYQDKFMNLELYHDTFDFFCGAIEKEEAVVLELACGPGNITKYVLAQRPLFKILGTDLAPNMLELARINNPTATFELMDCRDIEKLKVSYDALIVGFCLPYLSKEESIKLIADASKILVPNAVIYISTMEDDYNKSGLKYSSSGEDQAYIHYHEANYLVQALEDNGFDILKLERKNFTQADGSITIDLVLIAKFRDKI